jgi:hypothetical protein
MRDTHDAICPVCQKLTPVIAGRLVKHGRGSKTCAGSHTEIAKSPRKS